MRRIPGDVQATIRGGLLTTLLVAALVPARLAAQDSTLHASWSGYLDTYYAYDFGRPASIDRVYTTQAARHNEFNVNLAHVAVSLSGDRVRGRFALQAGTSVQANYAGEPSVGGYSGSSLSRHIQEATAGYRVGSGLWVDAGVYFSYIGGEGWISRDNANYTRSLVAEYSPYYLSGVKLTWQRPGSPVTVQLHVMNGWQNISETNSDKAVGGRVDWQVTQALSLGYAGFVGNELPDSVPSRMRVFNQVLGKWSLPGGAYVQGQVDLGHQGGSDWWGWVVSAHVPAAPRVAVAARFEGYRDPEQVILATGTPNGFKGLGASLGLDVSAPGGLLWRTEGRVLHTTADLFPKDGVANSSRSNVLLVSSLALML